jgi:ribonuclease Z
MSSSLEFITTPTADTPGTTLILRTQKEHYVFGSQAEGFQRALVQQGTRLLKVQDFFLTGRTEWKNVGGLVGLMLTVADSATSSYDTSLASWRKAQENGKSLDPPEKPHFDVHGPPNLKHMLGTCRRFIFRKGVPIVATEFADRQLRRDETGIIVPSWEDANIQVWALPTAPLRQDPDLEAEAELEARRRHFDSELNTFEDHQAPENESPQDREARYDRIRTATIKFMFDSNWSFDTLVERHISEVEMPAAMFVRSQHMQGYKPYTGPKPGGPDPLPDITVFTRTPWPGAKILSLPPTKPAPESVSYIVRTHSARGAFDVKRAKELGVKPGPDFGKLSSGQPVQNTNGETITPDQVLGPDKPGQGFAILDVPSIEYLGAITQREELQSAQIMTGVEAFVWILGPGVSGSPELSEAMTKYGTVKHIISSADTSPNRIAYDSVAGQTTRLAQIDPARYRVPHSDNTTLPQTSFCGIAPRDAPQLPKDVVIAERAMTCTLMPKFAIRDGAAQPLFDPEVVRDETTPEVLELAKAAQQAVQDGQRAMKSWKQLLAHPDTEITTLGTGSALPSKYRNVSATLVRVPGVGNYLFDAGENTLGQLQRVFPPEELVEILRELRMIWISHLHADHHLGTASVIRAWYQIKHNGVPNTEPIRASTVAAYSNLYGLSVISHEGMLQWLNEYSTVEDFGYSRILPLQISPVELEDRVESVLSIRNEFEQRGKSSAIAKSDYITLLGFADIQSVRVAHCHGSMAVSMTFPPSPSDSTEVKPLKVSYSGDCRPSMNFAKIGYDTTVLIHEATFDDELQGDARAKKHSTTSEALGVGAKMNAKAVVLTHFSQRYQKIPVIHTVQDDEPENSALPTKDVAEEVQNEDETDPTKQNTDNMDIHSAPFAASKTPTLEHGTPPLRQNGRVVKVRNKDLKVAIAFDYMRVRLGDIVELEKYNEALNELLAKEKDEDVVDTTVEVNSNGKRNSEDEKAGKSKKSKKQASKRNN